RVSSGGPVLASEGGSLLLLSSIEPGPTPARPVSVGTSPAGSVDNPERAQHGFQWPFGSRCQRAGPQPLVHGDSHYFGAAGVLPAVQRSGRSGQPGGRAVRHL